MLNGFLDYDFTEWLFLLIFIIGYEDKNYFGTILRLIFKKNMLQNIL